MATPEELRRALAELNTLARAELGTIWRALRDGDDVTEALHDILPGLIDTYGAAAASVASDWYDDLRESMGVGGRFVAIQADIEDTGAHALVGWALDTAADDGSLVALLEGGVQRRVFNFGRVTVMESSYADPRADGWQRVGVGANCPFCDLLISRGAVYSESTADFGAHDHCNCAAVPAFSGEPRPVKPYTPTARNITDDDRARVRAWLTSH